MEAKRAYHRQYYADRMKRLKDMAGSRCWFCKWNEYPEVLEWAHRHDKEKRFSVSMMLKKPWDIVVDEAMNRCYLACPTCHRLYDKGLPTLRANIGQ